LNCWKPVGSTGLVLIRGAILTSGRVKIVKPELHNKERKYRLRRLVKEWYQGLAKWGG